MRITFDHLLLQSRFIQGGTLSVEVAGGRPPETPFYLIVVGDAGILRLDGGAARGFQSGRLTVSVDGAPQAVDEGELAVHARRRHERCRHLRGAAGRHYQ